MNTQTITIEGISFTAPAPYEEGHVLKPNEASALNQTFSENLRNNFAKRVKLAKADGASQEVLDAATQTAFDAYAATYEFGVRKASGDPSLPKDPVLRVAHSIARDKIRALAKQKGHKLSPEQIAKLIPQLMDRNPAIMEEARRQVEAEKEISIEELDLPEPEVAAASAEGAAQGSEGSEPGVPSEGEAPARKRKRA